MSYGSEYYMTKNYTNYSQRGERYEHMTKEMVNLLNQLNLIDKESSILDYGCGFGFLSKALLDLGYSKTKSYDISEYALSQAQERGCNILENGPRRYYEIIFVLDVLEHMSDSEIDKLFDNVDCNMLIARIPVAEYKEKNFYLDVSKVDDTHINCKDKHDWQIKLGTYRFKTFLTLNLFSIYDSKGVFAFIALK